MTDIDKVLAEELPPSTVSEQRQPYNASEPKPDRVFPAHASAEHLTATRFPAGVSPNPGGVAAPSRYTLTRALKDALTIGEAEAVAKAAIQRAKSGDMRSAEFIRDSLEGKPGVRIADGEWNPEQSTTFNILAKYAAIVGQPQTDAELPQG